MKIKYNVHSVDIIPYFIEKHNAENPEKTLLCVDSRKSKNSILSPQHPFLCQKTASLFPEFLRKNTIADFYPVILFSLCYNVHKVDTIRILTACLPAMADHSVFPCTEVSKAVCIGNFAGHHKFCIPL